MPTVTVQLDSPRHANARCRLRFLALAIGCSIVVGAGTVFAASIPIPGYSFETPVTVFVNTHTDYWQKVPKPAWYVEDDGYTWDQLIGTFLNNPPASSDHLDNCDGNQASWLFAVPELGMFQDYDSTDWAHPAPIHAFTATYEAGKSYVMTVGLNGGGGNMKIGTTLLLSLYYRNNNGDRINIATTTVVNTLANFPTHTHFTDFQVRTPVVRPNDPWAGRHIGISVLSTVSMDDQGGYWDLDNFRLTSEPYSLQTPPEAPVVSREGTDVRLTWPAYSGYIYQLQTTTNFQGWTSVGSAVPGNNTMQSQLYPIGGSPVYFRVFVSSAAPGMAPLVRGR